MFGEGVYEVIRVYGGKAFKLQAHADRLARSLTAIGIEPAGIPQALVDAAPKLLSENGLTDANIYWQVTRGVTSPRSFVYGEASPISFAAAYPAEPLSTEGAATTGVLLADDHRWADVWVKTTMLLPNTLALNAAKAAGCDHALFVKDGVITEGNSSNFFAIIEGELWTHPANGRILDGITRHLVMELAEKMNLRINEQGLYASDLADVEEAFLTGTNTEITAVTCVSDMDGDSMTVGNGTVGSVTARLREAYVQLIGA